MRYLLLLLLAIPAIAQDSTNDVYLACRSVAQVTNVIAQINSALGYPNPATGTYTALSYQIHSNGTNCIVRVSLSGIWNAKTQRYVDLQGLLQSKLTVAQWGTNILSTDATLTDVQGKAVVRIDGALAKKIGGYFDKQADIQADKPADVVK